ncbi:MAG: NAD(P)/FAD-dependent oxidoreductase [Rhodocyclaceae bacterium]|nr:NAD(P)/FAD-dependent oxidoreductase [Rhodocyclaceae bacterium]MDZ4216327.1 NAD(P)/FAD-dependent oxidoreductase [Rhodocyclaceae bacterium]
MTDRVDAVVIGAGVVGLACARALARVGKETIILERHGAFGTETSARNSEVIHAGIYYPAGSLKASLCVSGRKQLYDFCERYGVEHHRCGKLIVATSPDQEHKLADIRKRAEANGADDLRFLTVAEAIALEPELKCTGALLSPSTGIIDSHGLMLALLGDAERHGAVLALQSPVVSAVAREDGIEIVTGGESSSTLLAGIVINSAGLSAPELAGRMVGFPDALVPSSYLAKGNYFSLAGKSPFSRLVYPVPEMGGLGVHLTLDLGGQARFGPDVEWIEEIDYHVDVERSRRFYGAIRKYWPGLHDGALQPAYSGIRPKIVGPGKPDADFQIQGPADHGVAGLVNLFGIESPGLTSCLSIGDAVCESLGLTQ